MTVEEVIDVARRCLADEDPSQERWDDSILFEYLNEALSMSYHLRPDLFLAADVIAAPDTITDEDDDVDMGAEYLQCLAYFVAYRALMDDNSDTANTQQAETYMKMYRERLSV
jgi:hypothetical protein